MYTYQISIALLGLLIINPSVNAQDALQKKHFNIKNGLAIEGYDPVAYIKQNKAIKENKQTAVVLQSVT